MSRILVLGGYGGFGGRISKRLADAGHEVLVAGRSEDRARTFCGSNPRLIPVRMNRSEVGRDLAQRRPDVLVDASGPFQAMDYAVPSACIDAGIHYLDIADGRAFVCGIATLDAAAKAAGVVVLSGASSVPALSGAVVRHLSKELSHFDAIEIAISASNRATAGPAVAAAILSQVGQPFSLWQGQQWTRAYGWQQLKKLRFTVQGQRPIQGRMAGLADVPDLALLSQHIAGRPAVFFRAGTELAFQNVSLWLASWLVRCGIIRTLAPFAPLLEPLQRMTSKLGSDRSAMIVHVFGRTKNDRVERRWTLIANDGHGPEIPSLSIAPLVARIGDGRERPGARDARNCLSLADYEPAFKQLAIAHETVTVHAAHPLYARVLGDRFEQLPETVRAMHDVFRDGSAFGRATVIGASTRIGGLIGRLFCFPRSGDHALHVHFSERDGVERWARQFGERRFHSVLSQHRGWLVERFGPFRFAFDLPSDKKGLAMVMRRWWVGPIRLPLALSPRVLASEWEEHCRFHFDVSIALPLIGTLVCYRGWLIPANIDER